MLSRNDKKLNPNWRFSRKGYTAFRLADIIPTLKLAAILDELAAKNPAGATFMVALRGADQNMPLQKIVVNFRLQVSIKW